MCVSICHVCDVHFVYDVQAIDGCSLTSNKEAKGFIQHHESLWNLYNCVNFSKRAQQSRRCFKFHMQTDGTSVRCSCFSHFLSHLRKQTQQQQQQHHQLAESASGSTRAAGQQQVNGFRAYLADLWCSLHALLVWILGGRLYSQRLSTANRWPTSCKESAHVNTDTTVCLGAAADGRRLLASSTGCTRQSCGSAGK